MKKVLLFASAVAFATSAFAQVAPADYDNSALDKDLNDSINKFYSVTSHALIPVKGLKAIDSTLLNAKKWWSNEDTKLYQLSFSDANELVVEFTRANGGASNYEDFNLVWAGWGKAKFAGKPTLYPFPYKVTGTAEAPVKTAVPGEEQDTLFGYAVDIHDNPVVKMVVKSSIKTNIRVDLIDKNRRVANVLAPHHAIATADEYDTLVFRWDNRPLDDEGVATWTFEDAETDDFNVGVAADGWAGKWWDIDAGRNTATIPLLSGKTAWTGAIVLDTKNIIGLGITIEDGSITADHSADYTMTDVKTVTIKSIQVGSETDYYQINKAKANATKPSVDKGHMVNNVDVDPIVSIAEGGEGATVLTGSNTGRVFTTTEAAVLKNILGEVVATSVNNVISTDVAAGTYFVVTANGSAMVSVQ